MIIIARIYILKMKEFIYSRAYTWIFLLKYIMKIVPIIFKIMI